MSKITSWYAIKKIVCIALIPILLTACQAVEPAVSNVPVAVRLPVGYIPNVQFAPLYVAIDKGYFLEQGIDLQLDYSMEIDAVALVGADELNFAIASGEQVLLGRSHELPVVYVATWYQDFPVGVVSLAENGISSPQDLQGRKVGIPMLSGASYIGLRALLNAIGLKESDITMDVIGFTQVESLVTGRDDAVVIYVANEPVQLEGRGYAVNVLKVADYQNLAGNGLITNESMMNENPELVQKMVDALMKGIRYAGENPDEAFQICLRYVENLKADDPIQRRVLDASITLWKADRQGRSELATWEHMQQVLLDMGLLDKELDLSEAYTNQFVAEP